MEGGANDMLKIIGIVFILGTCLLYGYQMKLRLQEHLNQLIGLKEMLLMLSGEISYVRTPLGEAFSHIAGQGKEPFSSFLKFVAEEMKKGQGKSFSDIWGEACEQYRKSFLFQDEEWKLLEDLGGNLGYLDAQMQLSHIQLHVQQLEHKIEAAQVELGKKQRLWQYLSFAGGAFLVIILL
jgi:stage III sporulation protein AB